MGEIRHILATDDASPELVKMKIERAEQLRINNGKELAATIEDFSNLRVGGLAVYIAMFEGSLRTADSHTLAAQWLGMHVRNRDSVKDSSKMSVGESKRDMVMNIVAQGFNAVVIRDRAIKTPEIAASISEVPIINAGNGWDDHPTQADADIYTAYKEIGDVEGLTVAIVGDNYNGRVNRADIKRFGRLGNRLVLVSVPGLEIRDDIGHWLDSNEVQYEETTTLMDAIDCSPDIVILSRFQEERYSGENDRTGDPWDIELIKRKFYEDCALTDKVLRSSPSGTKFLHPLPRGDELPDDSDPRVVIWPQVKNAVWARVVNYEYVFKLGPFGDA